MAFDFVEKTDLKHRYEKCISDSTEVQEHL